MSSHQFFHCMYCINIVVIPFYLKHDIGNVKIRIDVPHEEPKLKLQPRQRVHQQRTQVHQVVLYLTPGVFWLRGNVVPGVAVVMEDK